MWHALRAELAYQRPYLLGGLGLALGVATLISVIFWMVGPADAPPSHAADGLRGMFFIMAPLIVGFIAQSFRSEEHRARLLLAGPITPAQIAWSMVLLPMFLFLVGIVAASLALGVGSLVTGRLDPESINIVAFVACLLFSYTQLGLLIQEAVAARSQQRTRAASLGWACLVVACLLLGLLYVTLSRQILTWNQVFVGHFVVALVSMLATVRLYAARTDFTR